MERFRVAVRKARSGGLKTHVVAISVILASIVGLLATPLNPFVDPSATVIDPGSHETPPVASDDPATVTSVTPTTGGSASTMSWTPSPKPEPPPPPTPSPSCPVESRTHTITKSTSVYPAEAFIIVKGRHGASEVRVLNTTTGRLGEALMEGTSVVLSPDGGTLYATVTTACGSGIYAFRATGGDGKLIIPVSAEDRVAAVKHDGGQLAWVRVTPGPDHGERVGALHIVDVRTQTDRLAGPIGNFGFQGQDNVAVSADGRFYLSVDASSLHCRSTWGNSTPCNDAIEGIVPPPAGCHTWVTVHSSHSGRIGAAVVCGDGPLRALELHELNSKGVSVRRIGSVALEENEMKDPSAARARVAIDADGSSMLVIHGGLFGDPVVLERLSVGDDRAIRLAADHPAAWSLSDMAW